MNSIIEKGIKAKLISFDKEHKYITYIYQNKKRNYNNPEEQVQAESYLKLILDYGYPKEHISLFVSLTTGSTRKEADMVVYKDEKHTQPYIVVECKNKEVSSPFQS